MTSLHPCCPLLVMVPHLYFLLLLPPSLSTATTTTTTINIPYPNGTTTNTTTTPQFNGTTTNTTTTTTTPQFNGTTGTTTTTTPQFNGTTTTTTTTTPQFNGTTTTTPQFNGTVLFPKLNTTTLTPSSTNTTTIPPNPNSPTTTITPLPLTTPTTTTTPLPLTTPSASSRWSDSLTTTTPPPTPPVTPLPPKPKSGLCRDRFRLLLPPAVFRLWTCGLCFGYVYKDPSFAFFDPSRLLLVLNASRPSLENAVPDTDRPLEVGKVCRAVQSVGQDCGWWLQCCRAAQLCCERQLRLQAPGSRERSPGQDSTTLQAGPSSFCPATWDGFSCWDDSPAGRVATVPCPTYIEQASTDGEGRKSCGENGTWFVSPLVGLEWTDYTGCVALKHYEVVFWVAVVCDSISLLLLLPACASLLYFRSLRHQPRIRLHACLFVTAVLYHGAMLLHEVVVFRDTLPAAGTGYSVLRENSVWCRVLHIPTRYSWLALNTWMLLESLYLYRLMSQVFAAPRSLLVYYLTGFGVPWLFLIPYVSIRASVHQFNTRCWVPNLGRYEWIINTPIILCLVGCVWFLGKTLYIMMTKLQSHPNEPSNFRRGVKAVVMLVPLFGLQCLLVLFRPSALSLPYEVLSRLCIGTQGALVALVFCYLNGEVLTVYRNVLRVSRPTTDPPSSLPRCSLSTHLAPEVSCRSLVSFTHPPPSLTQSPEGEGEEEGGEESQVPLSPLGGGDSQCEDTDTCQHGLQNGLV